MANGSTVKHKADEAGREIGGRLVEERGRLGMNQGEFSDAIDYSQSQLSVAERGLPPKSWLVLRRMALLGVDINRLLTGKENGR